MHPCLSESSVRNAHVNLPNTGPVPESESVRDDVRHPKLVGTAGP